MVCEKEPLVIRNRRPSSSTDHQAALPWQSPLAWPVSVIGAFSRAVSYPFRLTITGDDYVGRVIGTGADWLVGKNWINVKCCHVKMRGQNAGTES